MCFDCNVPMDKASSPIQFTALHMCRVRLCNLSPPTPTACQAAQVEEQPPQLAPEAPTSESESHISHDTDAKGLAT